MSLYFFYFLLHLYCISIIPNSELVNNVCFAQSRDERLVNNYRDNSAENTLDKCERQVENAECAENVSDGREYLLICRHDSFHSAKCFRIYRVNDEVVERQAYQREHDRSDSTADNCALFRVVLSVDKACGQREHCTCDKIEDITYTHSCTQTFYCCMYNILDETYKQTAYRTRCEPCEKADNV